MKRYYIEKYNGEIETNSIETYFKDWASSLDYVEITEEEKYKYEIYDKLLNCILRVNTFKAAQKCSSMSHKDVKTLLNEEVKTRANRWSLVKNLKQK